MKRKNILLLLFGIYNAISVFPAIMNAFVFVIIIFSDFIPLYMTHVLCIFNILLSPVSCILGIVLGICRWKRGRVCALVCIILSIIGILLFAVVVDFWWFVRQGSWLRQQRVCHGNMFCVWNLIYETISRPFWDGFICKSQDSVLKGMLCCIKRFCRYFIIVD